MKYEATTKIWNKIKDEVETVLGEKKFRPCAYVGKRGFVSEVSFTVGKIGSREGMHGFSYMCDSCSQALLRRIVNLIPKKYIEKF